MKKYFENLDFLRFIAFFLVFTQHSLLYTFLNKLSDNGFYLRVTKLLGSGSIGVSFFFVLSGFLITYLILNEVDTQGKLNLKHFYIRRTLRIWPLFFLVVCFGFFIYPFIKELLGIATQIPYRLPYHLIFLSNFDAIYIAQNNLEATAPMMIGITWSVSIEEQFYLLWPLLFIVVPKKWYVYIFYAFIISCLVFRYLYIGDKDTLYFHTLSVMGDLAVGGLFAYYAYASKRFLNFVQGLPKLAIVAGYIIGFSLLLYGNYIYPTKWDVVYFRLIQTLFFAFIILEQNFAQRSPIKYGRFKLFSKLGKYTYGLYLLHPIGIQAVIIIYQKLHLSPTTPLYILLYSTLAFIISLVISYVSFHYFESYFLKLKKKYSPH